MAFFTFRSSAPETEHLRFSIIRFEYTTTNIDPWLHARVRFFSQSEGQYATPYSCMQRGRLPRSADIPTSFILGSVCTPPRVVARVWINMRSCLPSGCCLLWSAFHIMHHVHLPKSRYPLETMMVIFFVKSFLNAQPWAMRRLNWIKTTLNTRLLFDPGGQLSRRGRGNIRVWVELCNGNLLCQSVN